MAPGFPTALICPTVLVPSSWQDVKIVWKHQVLRTLLTFGYVSFLLNLLMNGSASEELQIFLAIGYPDSLKKEKKVDKFPRAKHTCLWSQPLAFMCSF